MVLMLSQLPGALVPCDQMLPMSTMSGRPRQSPLSHGGRVAHVLCGLMVQPQQEATAGKLEAKEKHRRDSYLVC